MALTPNIGMDLPVVGTTVDPTWATMLNTAVGTKLDQHNHTSGNGARIPTAALLIDNDLALNHFNLLQVNSVQLDQQISSPPLSLGSSTGVLLSYNGDLWWQKNGTTAVKITNGSSINLGAVATNVWTEVNIGVSGTIAPTDTYTYINFDATAAAIDVNLPAANAVTTGRYYVFKDATGAAATHNIRAIPSGTDKIDNVATPRSISQNFGSFFLVSNGIDGWTLFRDGPTPATTLSLGTVQIAGDLAGPGSIATSPKVVLASGSTGGLVTLAGDLAGPGSTSTTPRVLLGTTSVPGLIQLGGDLTGTATSQQVQSLTGVAGALSVAAGTTLTVPSTSAITMASGSTLNLDGTVTAAGTLTGTLATTLATTGTLSLGGTTTIPSGAVLDIPTGGSQTVEGEISVLSGGEIYAQSGAAVVINADGGAGSQINMTGGANINLSGGSYTGVGNVNLGTGSSVVVTGSSSCIYLQSGAKVLQKTTGLADVPALLPIFIGQGLAASQTITTTTFSSISGMNITFNNSQVGDVIVMQALYAWKCSVNAQTGTFRMAGTDGGVGFSTPDCPVASNNTSATFTNYASALYTRTVVNGGTITVNCSYTNGAAATTTFTSGPSNLVVTIYR